MATRTSALQRALNYFRTADVDEVRVAFTLAKEIVERRVTATQQESSAKPEKRKRKTRVLSPAEHTAMTASTKALKDNASATETLADA